LNSHQPFGELLIGAN